jgi:hypothetical protein
MMTQSRVVGDQHHDLRLSDEFPVGVWGLRHNVGTTPAA